MYGYKSWSINKAEHWRTDAFEPWCWRRLLRVPWTARRANQSILKEINPDYSLERLMLKLKLQHFGHLILRTNSLEKPLMLRMIEGRRRRGWQRMWWLNGITDFMDMSLRNLWGLESLEYCSPWGHRELDTNEWLNWYELDLLWAHRLWNWMINTLGFISLFYFYIRLKFSKIKSLRYSK